jgi:preprotein translocase subunit SecA
LNALSILGLDYEITKETFDKLDQPKLAEDLYNKALEHYHKKNKMVAEKALPIVKEIYKTRGGTVENILVPFTDGQKQIGVAANLTKAVNSNNAELVKSMEKMIALAIIDQLWKEHLREMDDLKQSVQNAVYEQKDPLLIYKFEAFELFKKMIGEINREVISFLFKAGLPHQQGQAVNQARAPQKTDYSRMREGRGAAMSNAPAGMNGGNGEEREAPKKLEPVRVGTKIGRNDPCPCGSGKKWKNCGLKNTEEHQRLMAEKR